MKAAKPAWYVYILAVMSGMVILSPVGNMNLTGYITVALILGFIWPSKSWRWGLWVSSPTLVVIGLSIAFAGLGPFISKDLLPLTRMVLFSCAGGILGAWIKERRIIL